MIFKDVFAYFFYKHKVRLENCGTKIFIIKNR